MCILAFNVCVYSSIQHVRDLLGVVAVLVSAACNMCVYSSIQHVCVFYIQHVRDLSGVAAVLLPSSVRHLETSTTTAQMRISLVHRYSATNLCVCVCVCACVCKHYNSSDEDFVSAQGLCHLLVCVFVRVCLCVCVCVCV